MRRSGALESIWNSGRYFGNNRSNAYVTVNPTWTLANDYSSSSSVYQWWRVPFRRWAETGTDIEVPKNVLKTISINRAMDQDAGQLTLTIKNVHPDGGPNLEGQGYFSIRQGAPQAGARWPGHAATAWGAWGGGDGDFHYGYLAPGCMIKTYQGWGGYDLSRSAALSAGNVVITGVWIIDDVNETATGDLSVSARDLGSLLVDQVMYPDFLPDGCYPTQFYSATWNQETNDDAAGFYPTATNYSDLCLDTETEVFTQRGWLRHDQVRAGDRTLSIDPETWKSEWAEILNVYERDGVHDMVRMVGTSHDSFATEGHKWLVEAKHGKRSFVTARDLNTNHYIPIAASRSDLPLTRTVPDEFVELMGWFWTEGYIRGRGVEISQSSTANPGLVDRIDAAMTRMYGPPGRVGRRGELTNEMVEKARLMLEEGVSAYGVCKTIGISDITLGRWRDAGFDMGYAQWGRHVRPSGTVVWNLSSTIAAKFLEYAPAKVLNPEFLCSLTQGQLDLLIDVSMLADGHTNKEGSRVLTQASEERLSAFTYLCSLAGYATSTSFTSGTGRGASDTWSATILKQKHVNPVAASRSPSPRMEVTREQYEGIVWCPSTKHRNWLARRNGKVYFTGNCDIVQLVALWAGFHAPSQDGMLGLLETTGIDSPAPFKADFFDKKTPIDVIKALGEIVGYRAWVNPEGGLHWTSQNTWQAGNRTYGGGYVPFAFDIDEYKTLMDFTGSWTKRADRSNVIVSQGNPAIMEGVKNANFNTNTAIVKNQLHGMKSPAFFPLDRDVPLKEMVTLAELTGLRMWFARHRGTLAAVANPLIDPDDQVRVFEKTTWETYLHRVRSVSTEYDEQSGHYTMNLDLMWVGPDNSGWQVTVGPEGHVNYNGGTE